MAQQIEFQLNLSKERYLAFYEGRADQVVARAIDGRTIQFPAGAIRQFLTHEGIQGRFVIHFDDNNKLVGIKKISA